MHTQKHVLEEKIVIIRIWRSFLNGKDSVGHASLEIPMLGLYFSLWPGYSEESVKSGVCKKVPFNFYTLSLDIDLMQRNPCATWTLYTLNLTRINQFYHEELLPNLKYYVLHGSNDAYSNDHSAENCSSIVYKLLVAGGIHALLPPSGNYSNASNTSIIVAPDTLENIIKTAKIKELSKAPITKSLDKKYINETLNNQIFPGDIKENKPLKNTDEKQSGTIQIFLSLPVHKLNVVLIAAFFSIVAAYFALNNRHNSSELIPNRSPSLT